MGRGGFRSPGDPKVFFCGAPGAGSVLSPGRTAKKKTRVRIFGHI